MSTYRKRIPYGMMNFVAVRKDDCYYVDKTRFIPVIEQANKFFFYIRPRRFGKSLTLSMLRHYYDVLQKDHFDALYGDLYVGQHPTSERNSYLILYLNFAIVNAELHNYRRALDAHCNTEFNYFCDVYADYLPAGLKEEMNRKNGAVEQLDFLNKECKKTNQKIYLFIDEYDHFTNKILSEPGCLDDYMKETHSTGYLRTFFDTIKGGTDSSIERCFVTGVSPVTMDDLTSGFNIGTNYSTSPEFNELTGFSEGDVREMLDYYRTTCEFHHSTDELIQRMKPWYDNYCFAEESYGRVTMYNASMVLYFVDNYVRRNGNVPKYMLDDNIRTDYNKLRMLVRRDNEFGHDASIIRRIAEQGYIAAELKTSFPARSITDPRNFVSLLYYFGMLSIDETMDGYTKLIIPNQVVREQLYKYLLDTYDQEHLSQEDYIRSELSQRLAYYNEWQNYFGYIAECLQRYASQRDKQKGESFVHGFTLAMTALNRFYRPVSEQECQQGYVDLYLRPELEIYKDMRHSYIVEFKYAKGKDTDERVEQLRQEAIAQANSYAGTERVKSSVGHTALHKIVIVYRGMEMVVCEEI